MPSVERVQWAKYRASVVIVVALMILGTLCYLLTGGTLLEPKATIYLYMPDAVGLQSGSPVRANGIDVGKVDSVLLSGLNVPDRVVKVTMIIERDRLSSIPSDSTAQATADTLIGDKFVDIEAGRGRGRLAPGGEVAYKASVDLMKRLDLSQFENTLRQVDALITDIETGRSPLGQFVKGDDLYQDLLRRVKEFQIGLHAAADTNTQLGQALYTDALYRQFSDPLRQLDERLALIQSGQGAGQLLRDSAQYEQLRASIGDLRKAVDGFRASEMVKSDAQYNDWNRNIESFIRRVDDFGANPLLTSTATYEQLNGAASELRSTLKDFRENPRKYLRLKVF